MEQFAFQQPPKNKQLCVDDDKLFQTRGPATQNARSPMVVRRALGMSSLAEAEDRSFFPPKTFGEPIFMQVPQRRLTVKSW